MIKLDLLLGVLLFGAWIYTLVDVAQTPDHEIEQVSARAEEQRTRYAEEKEREQQAKEQEGDTAP